MKDSLALRKEWDNLTAIENEALSNYSHDGLQQKYVLLLLVRVIELCNDCIMLLDSSRFSSVPILLRSALESYIDLKCMSISEDHIRVMNNIFNRWMSKDLEEKNSQKSIEFSEKVVGNTPKIKGRFELAGESKLYDTFYRDLCRHSHGNLERLVTEHSIESKISIGHQPDPERMILKLNQVITLKAVALREALEVTNGSKASIDQLHGLEKRLDDY